MKKFAIKGLIILGVVVLLCIFLSGTLRTITTAKVRIARTRTGRFEAGIDLSGSLVWPETVNLTIEGMTEEDTLVVRHFPVAAGSYVREGDLIAECAVSNYESRLAGLQESLSAKEKESLELERKNGSMVLTDQQTQWYSAYLRLQEAGNAAQLLRQDLRLAAWRAGVTLDREDALPEGCEDAALLELRAGLTAAEEEEASAAKAFDRMKMLNMSEDVVSYLDRKAELKSETDALTEDITALRILNERCASVRAPHAGYITAAELKAGDQVSMDTILVTMTAPDTDPVIRLEQEDSQHPVSVGSAVKLSAGDRSADSVISGQGVSAESGPYLDAAVTRTVLNALGGAAALTEEKSVSAKVSYQAESVTTLIPVTALRGIDGDYYIYTADAALDPLGAERFTISRKNVTVLDMNDSSVSIQETLKNDSVVYMEDRLLTDGCEVMLY